LDRRRRRTREEIEVHKIMPHLWFDKEAVEAAEFYSSTLANSRVTNVSTLHDTPSGDTDVVSFELFGQPFMATSAGPLFKFTPAVSIPIRSASGTGGRRIGTACRGR
jgi:predicted 3-demethylubiquinone-9 3-methyltransferase (glyoxalase superfamily)